MAFHQRHPSHRVAALTRPRLHPLSSPPRGRLTGLLWLGIGFFALMVVFTILTLPVEFDASRRGLILLRESGLFRVRQR